MATNLVPSSSTFTTANMLLDPDDQITADFLQDLADNTGYNYENLRHGMTNQPEVAFGTAVCSSDNGSAHVTTVTFASAKIDGVSTFSNSYVVNITPKNSVNIDAGETFFVNSMTSTAFYVFGLRTSGTGNNTFMWHAHGY